MSLYPLSLILFTYKSLELALKIGGKAPSSRTWKQIYIYSKPSSVTDEPCDLDHVMASLKHKFSHLENPYPPFKVLKGLNYISPPKIPKHELH